MKKINIIQHVPYETPGCIEDWIKNKSYRHEITKMYAGDQLPGVADIDWLIIMGGPMSIHDTEKYPWLPGEKVFIREAISTGKTVIGICLGAQLIAEALGGRVTKNNYREIGWFPVTKTGKSSTSLLTAMFNDTETVFHWHGETFEIPEGASHEFMSEACRNQCFVYKDRVIGLQFHVEVTGHLLEEMIKNGNDELAPGKYVQSGDQLLAGSAHIKRNNELMFYILDELDKL